LNINDAVKEYQSLSRRIKYFEEAAAVMSWDLQTGAPEKAVIGRSGVIGTISTEAFKMLISEQMEKLLVFLSNPENMPHLSRIIQVSVKEDLKKFNRFKKISAEKYEAYIVLTTQAEAVWKEAKALGDFAIFKPYLEKIVEFLQEAAELWGYDGHKYNAMLDIYEPGVTTEQLDKIFGYLKEKIIDLMGRIKKSGYVPDNSMFLKSYDKDMQRRLSLKILDKMQFDLKRGRLDESAHPFTIKLNLGDVRLTTKYEVNNLTGALFATIHEGGHGLYEQNIREDLAGTPLCTGSSFGIHESQSRYWENFLGRSRPFWEMFYDDLLEIFPEQFNGVSVENIYHGANRVEPSLIRVQADELTYGLHIILRYELEKSLIGGDIKVCDLPRLWDESMQTYLGIIPGHPGEGVLQDIHWSKGYFGYFPSYTLGNIYAAQFFNQMKKEIPDYDGSVENGDFKGINEWLKEKIHQHGKLLKPAELLHRVTGEEINPKYFAEYLEKKYREIYKI
jgi:carboxypeptidase Taq